MAKNTIEYKCPSCGAPLEFDIKKDKIVCGFCQSSFDVSEIKSFKKELENSEADTNFYDSSKIDYEETINGDLKIYHCESCGGEIVCNENTSATECPYCSSPVILKGRLSGELKPSFIIPFKKEKDSVKPEFQNYVKTKKLVPSGFLRELKVQEIKGLYVPYFIYSAKSKGDVVFSGEISSTSRHGDEEITETDHYELTRKGTLNFNDVPVDASRKLKDELMESIEPFDYSKKVDFDTPYLTGFYAEKYDVDKNECYKRAQKRMIDGTINKFKSTCGRYSALRVISSDINLSNNKYAYCLFPIWILNVMYKNENYTFAMNGESGKIRGNLPISKLKFTFNILGFLLLFSAVAFLIFFLLSDGYFEPSSIFASLLFGAIPTAIIMFFKKRHMKDVRFQKDANFYIEPNSFNLTEKHDKFLYTTTSRRRISNDD